jgi:hypothetical protein
MKANYDAIGHKIIITLSRHHDIYVTSDLILQFGILSASIEWIF